MIFHPPVLALLIGSLITGFMLVYASVHGVSILGRWDLKSGSEVQLGLERKTYLISTLVDYAFGFQLISLFLFVYTAEDLCGLFVGAMCAAGTLNVNAYGYPTLVLKIVNFLAAGTWLILNHVDNKAYDYPLIRKKYILLLLITPMLLAETVLQFLYFLHLDPDIITSCCGTLFGVEPREGRSALAVAAALPMRALFFVLMGITLLSGMRVYCSGGKGAYLHSFVTGVAFIVSITALLSVLSLYFYELPTHHCPFCLLKADYGYAGYPLYITLFGGTVSGLGVGAVAPFRKVSSLREALPEVQRRLALTSFICFSIFTAIILWKVLFSNLRLEGYL